MNWFRSKSRRSSAGSAEKKSLSATQSEPTAQTTRRSTRATSKSEQNKADPEKSYGKIFKENWKDIAEKLEDVAATAELGQSAYEHYPYKRKDPTRNMPNSDEASNYNMMTVDIIRSLESGGHNSATHSNIEGTKSSPAYGLNNPHGVLRLTLHSHTPHFFSRPTKHQRRTNSNPAPTPPKTYVPTRTANLPLIQTHPNAPPPHPQELANLQQASIQPAAKRRKACDL
ncbi:hypothetical protein F4818DRAFT_445155 [Hypoxylon cercidicola]|nr:hypothetical protein F4818DRAFT_445155 [Hypoxylon cercidicola]